MRIIKFSLDEKLDINEPTAVCLGYFDGIHIGHQKLIETARKSKYLTSVLTLDFSDCDFVKHKEQVLSLEDKEKICESLGVEVLFILKFNNEVMNLLPNEFIEKVLNKINAKELVLGSDYTFGKKASGTKETLIDYPSRQYEVNIVSDCAYNDQKISTTSIIEKIHEGNVMEASKMLGREYFIRGLVQKGFKYGRVHHFPTANIAINNYVKPRNGVYAVKVSIDEKMYIGMANVGVHPSINALENPILEVNIFDFDEEIYGKEIIIYFIEFIRPEMKFNNLEELFNQLNIDKAKVKSLLI